MFQTARSSGAARDQLGAAGSMPADLYGGAEPQLHTGGSSHDHTQREVLGATDRAGHLLDHQGTDCGDDSRSPDMSPEKYVLGSGADPSAIGVRVHLAAADDGDQVSAGEAVGVLQHCGDTEGR